MVPGCPSIIIDDDSGCTTTAYVELTARFVSAINAQYSVAPARAYGTGQSMGCMTVMDLAPKHPKLFTAEMLVNQ